MEFQDPLVLRKGHLPWRHGGLFSEEVGRVIRGGGDIRIQHINGVEKDVQDNFLDGTGVQFSFGFTDRWEDGGKGRALAILVRIAKLILQTR